MSLYLERVGLGEPDGGTIEDGSVEVDDLSGHVAEREVADEVVLAEGEVSGPPGHVSRPRDVVVTQHHTLRVTRRTRLRREKKENDVLF